MITEHLKLNDNNAGFCLRAHRFVSRFNTAYTDRLFSVLLQKYAGNVPQIKLRCLLADLFKNGKQYTSFQNVT